MPAIPALATWGPTGTITAAIPNTNWSTIRTYVNNWCAFHDAAQTWTDTQTFAAITATTATFSGDVSFGGGVSIPTGQKLSATDGTAILRYFVSSTICRIESVGSHTLRFGTAATGRWDISTTGHFLATTDNTYDIGASGATRPRNLYIAGTGDFAGTLTTAAIAATTITASGAITANGGLDIGTNTLTMAATGTTNAINFTGAAPRFKLASSGALSIYNNAGTQLAVFNAGGFSVIGASGFNLTAGDPALGSSSTGFLVAGTLTGSPSGTPSTGALVVDKATPRLWVYCTAGWRSVALS